MRIAMLACGAGLLAAAAAHGAWAGTVYAGAAAVDARPLAPVQRLERRFLQLAAANLRFQSEASQLAIVRSGNPAVKDLANTVLARQQAAQPELLRLLQARGMAMPMPGNAHNKTLRQLAKLQAGKFDRVYVEELIRSCQEDIPNHEKLAAEAMDPQLKAWVDRQLPTLRFHLAKAGRALPPATPLRSQRAL